MFKYNLYLSGHPANLSLLVHLERLGYDPMYQTFKYNIEGENLITDNGTYHYSDTDNKTGFIDCGTDIELFIVLSSIQTDSDMFNWFILSDGSFVRCGQPSREYLKSGSLTELEPREATVEEIINHFKNKK